MARNSDRLAAALAWVVALGAFAAPRLQAGPAGAMPAPAQALISDAVDTAKAENKAVLVHFGASWCGWCKRFAAFLHGPRVGKVIADHYLLVALTVQEHSGKEHLENPGAEDVLNKMSGAKAGLPYYVFLDGTGAKIADSNAMAGGENIGYPAEATEIEAFVGLLERTAPRMTRAQRTEIAAYLTENRPGSRAAR